MPTNHLETIKQVYNHLQTIIEKIDSLDFCPIFWEDSFSLLRELEKADAELEELYDQLYTLCLEDSSNDAEQNNDLDKRIHEVYLCFAEFSMHFSKIYSVLEEEGPKEWYDQDYEHMSAQLKNAKQHLEQILM